MKRRDEKFFPFPWEILNDRQFYELSPSAKIVVTYLLYYEHKFAESKTDDKFFVVDADLSEATGLGLRTITDAKKEIKEKLGHIIEVFYLHWRDTETGKRSKKHVTGYRFLV